MLFEFDPVTDLRNQGKHGVSLDLARHASWARAVVRIDRRRVYGEQRMVASVPIEGVLHMIVFTEREDRRRVISVRRANQRERNRYVEQIELEIPDR